VDRLLKHREARAEHGVMVTAHLPIVQGSGSPCRALALVERTPQGGDVR
jgi:kynurenine formamidase